MREAINMVKQLTPILFQENNRRQAELALSSDETPVGCVFVHNGEIIGQGMNDTNRSMNVCLCWKFPIKNIF
jgi:tRNA(Arg) A34 adenosine deaminase TadA